MDAKLVSLVTHKPLQRLVHNPQVTKILATSLALAPIAVALNNDVFVKEKATEKVRIPLSEVVPADETLFDWAKKKPELNLFDINPKSLAWVHMTEYFPENGKILSTKLATKDENGVGYSRATIHGSINKVVTEHMFGNNWTGMKYAVIAPFDKLIETMPESKVIGGIQDDFFFQDLVQLPKGSVIVKYNPDIEEGSFQISEAFPGIKLVETSNKNMGEATNLVIKKMGYDNYNDIVQKQFCLTDEEAKTLFSMPETNAIRAFKNIKSWGGSEAYRKSVIDNINSLESFREALGEKNYKESLENCKIQLKFSNLSEKCGEQFCMIPNGWDKFCKDNDYLSTTHIETPWGKTEMALAGINILVLLNKNNWENQDEDFKQAVLKSFKDAKEALPKGKNLGYDIDDVISIIENSKTPQEALDEMAQKYKIKPLPGRAKLEEEIPEEGLDFFLSLLFMQMGIGY